MLMYGTIFHITSYFQFLSTIKIEITSAIKIHRKSVLS